MRRPGSNECLQDKPRNRHFAEWRFLPLIRTVTVNPKIWNVIVIGMSLTSLPEDTVTNRLPYSFGALGGHKTIFILPKTAHFVNSRRRTSPPRSARHLPFTRGGFSTPAPKAPLVKGSWRAAPERLPRRSGQRLPSQGSCLRSRLRGCRKFVTTSPSRSACHLPCKGRLFSFLQTTPARDTIGAKGAIG